MKKKLLARFEELVRDNLLKEDTIKAQDFLIECKDKEIAKLKEDVREARNAVQTMLFRHKREVKLRFGGKETLVSARTSTTSSGGGVSTKSSSHSSPLTILPTPVLGTPKPMIDLGPSLDASKWEALADSIVVDFSPPPEQRTLTKQAIRLRHEIGGNERPRPLDARDMILAARRRKGLPIHNDPNTQEELPAIALPAASNDDKLPDTMRPPAMEKQDNPNLLRSDFCEL